MLEVYGWKDGVVLDTPEAEVVAVESPMMDAFDRVHAFGATFGFVVGGQNALLRRHDGFAFPVPAGTFFVIDPLAAELTNPGGRILLITRKGADFPFALGTVEKVGRLRYIDGCTDSLLVPAWKLGEACLNHLHIPPGVEQTMHTHPSDRIGVVFGGHGQCVTPEGTVDLVPGMIWRIPADGLHRFRTEREGVDIVAFHPDSDFGPTDDDHPMLRKTFVGGVSATQLDDIRTR